MPSKIGCAFCLAATLAAGAVHGAEFDTGSDVHVRWDTTLRATLGLRTEPADPALLADPNADDGDRSFGPGFMSERVDAVTQLDVSKGDLGLDISADGWYDAAYHGTTANRAPATFNPVSVPNTAFPKDVQALDGGTAELLTAYVHDRFDIDGTKLTIRLGRQTLLWGESLFFADNGIAAGQAPMDGIKALSQPLAQARELFLPVNQAVVSLQPSADVLLEGYVQAEWRPDRLPGVASYFSTTDILDAGGERLFDGDTVLDRTNDRRPAGIGQFGLALHVSTDVADIGAYALRFDAKSPEIFTGPGQYGLIYPTGIALYGASASMYVGNSTLAGEISLRRNMPLVSRLPAVPEQGTPYAAGNTLHGQISLVSILPTGRLWQGASVQAELAASDVLSVSRDASALAPGRDNFSAECRAAFTPQYFQVLPHLDLTVPVGLGLDLAGQSRIFPDQNAGTGDVDIGLGVTYRAIWQAGVSFTHFIGSPTRQPLADRDFVILTVARTF